jgi:hypothetical protein
MSRLTKLVLAALLVLAAPAVLLADVTGKILGTVTDPSGSAVVGATVTLRNGLTGYAEKVSTDASGYQFLAVPIGEGYEVTVEAAGFSKAVQSGVTLFVNQDFRADFQLQVGTTSQTVEASAAAMQVETASNQLGDVIQDTKMTEMPLNGRSFVNLLGLQAGVVPQTSSAAFYPGNEQPVSGNGFGGMFSVNGARESGNSFNVNGGDVQNNFDNGTAIVPTLDSIQEFRLLTNTTDAEYGRATGAIVNVVTKSGTNQIHGDAYEFARNAVFDSANFLDYGQPKGALEQNQFGGAFGSHIIRNRLFYFLDYQGTRQTQGISTETPVPSTAMRGGDFSGAAADGFSPLTGSVRGGGATNGSVSMDQTLTNRLGYLVTNNEPYWVPGCNTAAQSQAGMCVFFNQVIPKTAWSSAANGTLQFIQSPTLTSGGTPYWSSNSGQYTLRDDKAGARIDLTTQATGTWSLYYHVDDATVFNPYQGNMPGFPQASPTRAQQILLGDTKLFGPESVNQLRLNYTRNSLDLGKRIGGLGAVSTFGFVAGGLGLIPQIPSQEGVPGISLNQMGLNFANYSSVASYNDSYELADSFSRVAGRHTLKVGFDLRKLQINSSYTSHNSGTFGFAGSETGNDFADYLLGAPDGFTQTTPGLLNDRSTYFGLFAQDSFKLKPNFTVNAGIRWEVSTPWADTKGRVETFIPGEESKLYPDAPEGWVFPGDPGVAAGMYPTDYKNIGPRVGIAYSPGFTDGPLGTLFGGPGKTSIRAAFGIYYTAYEEIENTWESGNPPFAQYWNSPDLIYLEQPYAARNGPNPGQRFPFTQAPPGTTGIWDQYLPLNSTQAVWTHMTTPYAEQWNFSIQREIPKFAILTLGYLGNQGHHLFGDQEANPGSPQLCLSLSQPDEVAPGSPTCGPFGENNIYTKANGQVVYGTRPYSVTSGRGLSQGLLDFGDLVWEESWQNSHYNSLQVSLQRDAGPFSFLAAYTWSKTIDDQSGFNDLWTNPYDPKMSRALSAYDVPQNFVVSYAYELPFQKLAGGERRLLSGWQISGITRFTSGQPVTLQDSADPSLCGSGGGGCDFPVYNGQPVHITKPTRANGLSYFSASNFSAPQLGTFGATSRRFFFGPGTDNTDLSLHKITRVTEGTAFEIRVEYFNAFNRVAWGQPVGDFNSSSFGNVTSTVTNGDQRIGQMGAKFTF